MKLSNYDPVEFKFLAERARNRGDYETAARFFRYLMVHFGVVNDEANRRRFAVKSGGLCEGNNVMSQGCGSLQRGWKHGDG